MEVCVFEVGKRYKYVTEYGDMSGDVIEIIEERYFKVVNKTADSISIEYEKTSYKFLPTEEEPEEKYVVRNYQDAPLLSTEQLEVDEYDNTEVFDYCYKDESFRCAAIDISALD